MSILTKRQILERIEKGDIEISPSLDSLQLQAHSIDLRLGFTFLTPKMWRMSAQGREAISICPLKEYGPEFFDIVELEQGQFFDLLPQEYVLVSSLESIKIPYDIMSVLYPRSSTNRKGLSLDLTGIIDAGYQGQLTLPVRNNTRSQTIRIYPGERFCQLVFDQLAEPAEIRKSRYHQRDIIQVAAKEKDDEEVEMIMKGTIRELKQKYDVAPKPPVQS